MAAVIALETNSNGVLSLHCTVCPDKPDYKAVPPKADWNMSCQHIQRYIQDYEPLANLESNLEYQMNLSRLASYLCRDIWTTWVTISIGEAKPSGVREAHLKYESDTFSNTSAVLGNILPEDGMQTVLSMVWDYVSSQVLERQPQLESAGLRCPLRTHNKDDNDDFHKDLTTQEGMNAQVACIALENCCCYCYRRTFGNDADDGTFGMSSAAVTAAWKPQSLSKGGIVTAARVTGSVTTTSLAGGTSKPSAPINFNLNTNKTAKQAADDSRDRFDARHQKMSEKYNDPNLPF